MIKKAYYKPTMKMVRIKPQTLLTAFSNVETEGLDEELNDNGGSDDMESAAW